MKDNFQAAAGSEGNDFQQPLSCYFCRRALGAGNRSGVCSACHWAGKARCSKCGGKTSRGVGLCSECKRVQVVSGLAYNQVGREGRPIAYARRAQLRLPLFDADRPLIEGYDR